MDKQLFFSLLKDSMLFDDRAKELIRIAVKDDVLPELDFEYILYVLKQEKNYETVIDELARKRLSQLKKKYSIE